jgi:light-regulated signal transduction histidine kinase (bacteriophytochrome)
MTEPLDGFGQMYVSALKSYLETRDEAALSRAYELGREAVAKGLGVLDMASLHQAAVGVLVISTSPASQLQIAQTAAEFFAELLSPFEMSFRGYRAANHELKRLNESLRQQKEAVEIANRELESFSYSVSHDLRAPLRSVDGFSQILLEDFGAALGDGGRRHVQRVRSAAQHMAQLIDHLLSLARVTRSEMYRAEVNLTTLALRLADWLRQTSLEREVAFIVDEDMRGNGDPTLLAVVLENLLGNAWKFTSKRPHAEIRFGCEDRAGLPTYFVRDNGAGFDMAYARKLFAPFQRLHTANEFEGTGIGLATVQRVVHRHGGDVWAEGKSDDGATFYFTLGGGRRS